jgi:hypothetical protein
MRPDQLFDDGGESAMLPVHNSLHISVLASHAHMPDAGMQVGMNSCVVFIDGSVVGEGAASYVDPYTIWTVGQKRHVFIMNCACACHAFLRYIHSRRCNCGGV